MSAVNLSYWARTSVCFVAVTASNGCTDTVRASDTPFSCFGCCQLSNRREMKSLKSTVDLLKQEIVELKESLSSAKSDCNIQVRNENLHPSYSPANTTNGDFTYKLTPPPPPPYS